MNICTNVFLGIYVSNHLGIYIGMELPDHIITVCLTFWGTGGLFF
jgi:hypothetical protein